jgi:curli biogenesis system outer membrane secretion channel CsgG
VKTGEFSVIERRQIETILAEQNMGASGLVDPATAARVGKLLGAPAVIVGSITCAANACCAGDLGEGTGG